jgi:hypothetical protein
VRGSSVRSGVVRGAADLAGHTAPTMRAWFARSIVGAMLLVAACAAPHPTPPGSEPPAAAGSIEPSPSGTPRAPLLTYNPAQWPDPLDTAWLGGEWLLVAAVPGPRIEPVRYFLDFGREILVTDEDGNPLTWAGGLESVEWSDPHGTWTVKLHAPEPCGRATYSVTIRGGLIFVPLEESCRERFGILVNDAWMRPRPAPSPE